MFAQNSGLQTLLHVRMIWGTLGCHYAQTPPPEPVGDLIVAFQTIK